MNRSYYKEEEEFLSDIAVDYVSLGGIYRIVTDDFEPLIPSKEVFKIMLSFISFLMNKYKKHFICLEGPDMKPIKKSSKELVSWLQQQYDKGKYRAIDYGIWFDLDESVIPKEYLPKIDK